MNPKLLVLSTYKTRVAPKNPCRERLGSVIGQSKFFDVLAQFSRARRLSLEAPSATRQYSPGICRQSLTALTDPKWAISPTSVLLVIHP